MKITINSDNINDYRLGTFPDVTIMEWCARGQLDEDVLACFSNVAEFYCGGSQLTSLQGISQLTKLQKLCCDSNQLTSLQGIDGLTNLQTLDCSHNQLASLQGISKLTNLQKLWCGHNRLTSLQDISGLTNLRLFVCNCNRLTSLHGISRLTNLHILFCNNNQLTSLRDSGGLTNLSELHCGYNQLTSLQGISGFTNLQRLYCDRNQITSLDPVVYLRHLHVFCYQCNPVENPSVQVQRFLARLRQQRYTNSHSPTTIYDDRQNVHDITVQTSTRDSLSNLMRDTVNGFNLTDVLQSQLSESSRNAITEYCNDDSVHSYFLVTYQELFSRVWNRIINSEHQNELVKILDEQIQDAECKCMTGRFVRTMSVLVGFYDDIVIGISDNAQIAAVIETARKTIIPYNAQRHVEVVHQQLTEMGYRDDQIGPWLEAILDL